MINNSEQQLSCSEASSQGESDRAHKDVNDANVKKIELRYSFNGVQQYADAVRQSIVQACKLGAIELILCDPDFSLWPLDDQEVIGALKSWANSTSNQRMLTVIASTYKVIEMQHGMWVRWRKTWDHRVRCRQVNLLSSTDLPSVFWCQNHVLTVFDKDRSCGKVSDDRQTVMQFKGHMQELIHQSEAAFPASTLGL